MNQSQYEYQVNHREKANHNLTQGFSPEVHVLAGTLAPVVSTNTWWFGG
jgi:hypothetical protein